MAFKLWFNCFIYHLLVHILGLRFVNYNSVSLIVLSKKKIFRTFLHILSSCFHDKLLCLQFSHKFIFFKEQALELIRGEMACLHYKLFIIKNMKKMNFN